MGRSNWANWAPTVSGPLAEYAPGYQRWLIDRGFTPEAKGVADRLWQLDQLSRWLEREGLASGELTGEQAERFVPARRAAGLVKWVSPQSVMLPLAYLRELGLCRRPAASAREGPLEELLDEYRRYLRVERGRLEHTVSDIERVARLFLGGRDGAGWAGPGAAARGGRELVPGARVPEAQRVRGAGSGVRAAVVAALSASGRADRVPLVWAVPSVADLRDRTLPRGLEPGGSGSCWPAAIGARWSAGVTTRSCCCCRGWGCAPARSPRSRLDDVDWRRGRAARSRQGQPAGRAAAARRCRRGARVVSSPPPAVRESGAVLAGDARRARG